MSTSMEGKFDIHVTSPVVGARFIASLTGKGGAHVPICHPSRRGTQLPHHPKTSGLTILGGRCP